ncbi:hypothetical protein UPYG_G00151280 [Umbra pygmaea]|uniref:Zona pellucida sperm-binding protein 3 n=1 Tax=Umbra pygmaea TaxID=75934 RepID=A0ABD0WXG2_UMBPY
MTHVAWMFCLSVMFFSVFQFTKVSAEVELNVYGKAGQGHETYQFAELYLQGNAPLREVTRQRIGEDDAVGGPWSIQAPYYFLPMFQHSAVPLADKHVFKPVAGKTRLPTVLTNLLLPKRKSPELKSVYPVRNPRGVEVWCGYNQISVLVNRNQLGFRCLASMLFLGTCPVTRVTPFRFYFHYNLNDCGSTQTTMNGQLVYSSSLYYSPLPEGSVVRAIPLNLPIHCSYNRFHYSYKVGYVPEMHERTFLKRMKTKHTYSLAACNVEWKHLSPEESYMLGEPMYFEASAAFVSKSQRLFVGSCFVTPSKDPNTTPRLEVINNFGCMVDSKREGSRSQFFSREANVLLFSVDAFLFPHITGKYLYLHCTMTVGKSIPKQSTKSCTYNSALQRWEELYGPSSVCSCCDSFCEESDFWPDMSPSTKTVITSEAWKVLDKEKHALIQVLGQPDRVDEMTFKSLAVTSMEEELQEEEVAKFKSLAVTPWQQDKNASVTPLDNAEVRLKHLEVISRKEGVGKIKSTQKMHVVKEETQKEPALGVTDGLVVTNEVSLEEIEDKLHDTDKVMAEVEEKYTIQVTKGVPEDGNELLVVTDGVMVNVSEQMTEVFKEVAQQNRSSEVSVVTMNAEVRKSIWGVRSKVDQVGLEEIPTEDEAAAFLQGHMEPAEWNEDYKGSDLGSKQLPKDKLAVLKKMSLPTSNTDINEHKVNI